MKGSINNIVKSFYTWCIENNKQELLDLWDYELNICSPREINFGTKKKYYFRCMAGIHESELWEIHSITSYNAVLQCRKCKSFGQYLINTYGNDALSMYWDYDKNIDIDPFLLSYGSGVEVYLYCQEKPYHGSYKVTCSQFVKGYRCSYCSGLLLCKLDSLGCQIEEAKHVWSDLNEVSIYDYKPKSRKEVYWKCENSIHQDYLRTIRHANKCGFKCPECLKEEKTSYLQSKVKTYISDTYGYELKHEYDCSLVPINPKSKRKLPFDNEIPSLKLIIEVHGEQHYDLRAYKNVWKHKNITPEQQLHKVKLHDRYKKYVAFCRGYFYLVIPFWTEKDKSYQLLIDDAISKILKVKGGDLIGKRQCDFA